MQPTFPRPPFLWSESAPTAGAARENGAMTGQEAAASVASRPVRKAAAWLLGAFALFGFLRRRREPEPELDPRAEELRRKLDESRSVVDEREQDEEREVTVDLVEDPAARRASVHESARDTIEEMRKP